MTRVLPILTMLSARQAPLAVQVEKRALPNTVVTGGGGGSFGGGGASSSW